MSSELPPPGWYQDPQNPAQSQWWDGQKWTGRVAPSGSGYGTAAIPPPPQSPHPLHIPNYLPQAILVTIFCCWPFGIPAIVFAAQVNSKAAIGDTAGALESSRKAKMWCWVSFGVTIGFFVLAVVIGAIGELSQV